MTRATQPARRDPLGPAGERAAARYLRRRGYRVLGRNIQTAAGEADLVCEAPDRRTIVIVEVKSRRRIEGQPVRSAETAPEASVTAEKRRKLGAIARTLAALNRWTDRPLRIDVVAVERLDRRFRRWQIRHLPDAVR
ncbi:MAG: YraN family protein [Phycisphaerales bacterium JB039]